jgi:hypothetical protein
VNEKKPRATPLSEGDERTAPHRNEPRSRASRDRHPIGERMGQSSGGPIHLGGDDRDERGGYSEEGMRGGRREPYFGTRLGNWEETPRNPASASAERAQHDRDPEPPKPGPRSRRKGTRDRR